MTRILIVCAVLGITVSQAAASDATDVVATVRQFADAFNKGDVKAVPAACADEALILDEFPPYAWHGTGACAHWMSDYDADAKKNGITDGQVTLKTPRHVDIVADRAYVVVSANYAYKRQGKPVEEKDSALTVVLQKSAAGWRITAWSWAKS